MRTIIYQSQCFIGPGSALLHFHDNDGRWGLNRIHTFTISENNTSVDAENLAREIVANCLILQTSGNALFFKPHSRQPLHIVQIDRSLTEGIEPYLREYTQGDEFHSMISILTGPDHAELFYKGLKVAISKGGKWMPILESYRIDNFMAQLGKKIEAIEWVAKLYRQDDLVRQRLKRLYETIAQVSFTNHGALFFLEDPSTLKPVMKSPMAEVWVKPKRRRKT